MLSGKQEVPIRNLQLKQVMVQLKCDTKSSESNVSCFRLVVEQQIVLDHGFDFGTKWPFCITNEQMLRCVICVVSGWLHRGAWQLLSSVMWETK